MIRHRWTLLRRFVWTERIAHCADAPDSRGSSSSCSCVVCRACSH
jgi:hypothetical protein